MSEEKFETWAILELLGHRRLAGFVSEVQIGGASFIRIDIPGETPARLGAENKATQFYSPQAIYCITPASEDTVKAMARCSSPPVQHWELPQLSQEQTEINTDLLGALEGLLQVIETDNLIPESVSYMQAARDAVARAEGDIV